MSDAVKLQDRWAGKKSEPRSSHGRRSTERRIAECGPSATRPALTHASGPCLQGHQTEGVPVRLARLILARAREGGLLRKRSEGQNSFYQILPQERGAPLEGGAVGLCSEVHPLGALEGAPGRRLTRTSSLLSRLRQAEIYRASHCARATGLRDVLRKKAATSQAEKQPSGVLRADLPPGSWYSPGPGRATARAWLPRHCRLTCPEGKRQTPKKRERTATNRTQLSRNPA